MQHLNIVPDRSGNVLLQQRVVETVLLPFSLVPLGTADLCMIVAQWGRSPPFRVQLDEST